jgi:lipopolysaccharide export system permease protein
MQNLNPLQRLLFVVRGFFGSILQRVGIRKLDLLILRSYIGPFIVTFFISMFLFLMQFLWKWIEELVGKGIGLGMLSKLLLFSLPDLVPMALPLTIMVAGLMTFGNLSESFELVAMKANGISLGRALRPIFILMCLLAIANFFFLNYVTVWNVVGFSTEKTRILY